MPTGRRHRPPTAAVGPSAATATCCYLREDASSPCRVTGGHDPPSSPPVTRPGSGSPSAPRFPHATVAPQPAAAENPLRPCLPRAGRVPSFPFGHVLLATPGKPKKPIMPNGFGRLSSARHYRPSRRATAAWSPCGHAGPAPGARAAGARPRWFRPRPRATDASPGRTEGTGGVRGTRRRPPLPWLSRQLPARTRSLGRTARDLPQGTRLSATMRAVHPPARRAGLVPG